MSHHIYFAEAGLPKLRPDYSSSRTASVIQRLVLPNVDLSVLVGEQA
jgi:hypothetical protein